MVVLIPIIPLIFAVLFRASTGLCARAIGERQTISDGWGKFTGEMRVLYGFSWLVMIFGFVLNMFTDMFSQGQIIGSALVLASMWVSFMFYASILTTLYHHFIQGRELK